MDNSGREMKSQMLRLEFFVGLTAVKCVVFVHEQHCAVLLLTAKREQINACQRDPGVFVES